jgi:hypothetical protein
MAMNVYQVYHTEEAPRIYATPNHDQFAANVLLDLTRLAEDAKIPAFQKANPELSCKGFFHLSNSVLVFTKATYASRVGPSLDLAGRVYVSKITDTAEQVYFLNVTAFYNCLDRAQTVFYSPSGEETGVDHQMGIKSPAFFTNLIGDSLIFKIPQMPSVIFAASDGTGTENDFYTLYRESALEGLRFKLVWNGQ